MTGAAFELGVGDWRPERASRSLRGRRRGGPGYPGTRSPGSGPRGVTSASSPPRDVPVPEWRTRATEHPRPGRSSRRRSPGSARPGCRPGAGCAPGIGCGSPPRRPGSRATTTSPSVRPAARTLPSGLQAAAGTAARPPGNGQGPLGLQVPERIAGIPGLAVDHGFRDQVAPPGWKRSPPGQDPSVTTAWSGVSAWRPQMRARTALASRRSGSAAARRAALANQRAARA